MENIIINNKVADENERMDYATAEIISNRGTVKVHGNEFNFENMSINGQETGASVVYARIHKDNNFNDNKIDIPLNGINDVNVCLNDKIYHKPGNITLNEDFSLKEIALTKKSNITDIREADKKEKKKSYAILTEVNTKIYTYNFYNFDKNKNIIGLKQPVTYSISISNNEELNKLLKKMKKENKKNNDKDSLLEQIQKIVEETIEKCEKDVKNGIAFRGRNIDVIFTDNYNCAYVLGNATLANKKEQKLIRKLFLFKKDKEQNKYNLCEEINIPVKDTSYSTFARLTVIEDKIFIIAYDGIDFNIIKGFTVFDATDKKIAIRFDNIDKQILNQNNIGQYRCFLSRLNLNNNSYELIFSYGEFQKKVKVFYDKCVEKQKKEDLKKKQEEEKEKQKKKKSSFFSFSFFKKKENKEEEKKNKNNTINNFDEEEEEEINTSKKEVKIKKKEDEKKSFDKKNNTKINNVIDGYEEFIKGDDRPILNNDYDEEEEIDLGKKEDEEEPLNKINYRTKEEVEIIERKRKEKEKREKEEKKKEYNERSKNKILFFSFNDDKQKKKEDEEDLKEEDKKEDEKELKQEVKDNLKGANNKNEKGNGHN